MKVVPRATLYNSYRRNTALIAITTMCFIHPQAHAEQSPGILSAQISSCNVSGTVELIILDRTTAMQLPCLNQSEQASPGTNEHNAAGSTLGVPGIPNLAEVKAAKNLSGYLALANTTVLTGETRASSMQLAQGLVKATSVEGRGSCMVTPGSYAVQCVGGTTLETLTVSGQHIPLPRQPMPLGYQLAKIQGELTVAVLGIPVSIPVSGVLKGNNLLVSGVNTKKLSIRHAPLSLQLEGGISFIADLIKIKVNIVEASTIFAESTDEASNVTIRAVSTDNRTIDCTNRGDGLYSDHSNSCSNTYYACNGGNAMTLSCPARRSLIQKIIHAILPGDISACAGTNTRSSFYI